MQSVTLPNGLANLVFHFAFHHGLHMVLNEKKYS